MADKPILMLVGTSIPTFASPEKADEYVDWYKKVHMPLALKAPGMLNATLYKGTKWTLEYPSFLCVYEMESKDVIEKAMQSPEMAKANEDGHKNGVLHGMVVRWHVYYEPV